MKSRVQKTDSIRVHTGAKRIEVNDEGEYITLNFADQSFVPRFFAMLDHFAARQTEYETRGAEIDNDTSLEPMERSKKVFQLLLDLHLELKEQVDNLFGPDTCKKVFGDIVPSLELYSQFFDLISPYFSEYAKERNAMITKKYSPQRKGGARA